MTSATTPPDFAAGGEVTSTYLNTYIRDNWKALMEARAGSWTPTLSATSLNTTYTIQEGRYCGGSGLGKLVIASATVVLNTVTNAGSGDYSITLPIDPRVPASGLVFIGEGWIYDVSATTRYKVNVERTSSLTAKLGRDASSGYVGAAAPFAWATGDMILLNMVYEAA